jgi:hypothetical protein
MLSFTLESLDRLARRGRLTPSPASPLGFLRARADGPAPPVGADLTGAATPQAREALAIVGRPQARVWLRTTWPGAAPVTIPLLLRGGRACAAALSREGAQLGDPIAVESLVDSLVDAIGAPGPMEGASEATFSVEELKVLAWLWPGTKRGLDAALPRDEAMARLAELKATPELAATALDDLVTAGTLAQSGRDLSLAPRLRPWLDIAWCGRLLEIEVLALPGDEPPADPPRRLLFAGPAGRRVLSRAARPGAPGPEGGDDRPAAVVTLASLPAEAVRALVTALLATPGLKPSGTSPAARPR